MEVAQEPANEVKVRWCVGHCRGVYKAESGGDLCKNCIPSASGSCGSGGGVYHSDGVAENEDVIASGNSHCEEELSARHDSSSGEENGADSSIGRRGPKYLEQGKRACSIPTCRTTPRITMMQ